VEETLKDLNFSGVLVAKTHDNARNMVNAMSPGDEKGEAFTVGESIRCNAHLLNLAVQDVFNQNEGALMELQQRCRNITKFFNKSSVAHAELLREQRDGGIKLPQKVHADVPHSTLLNTTGVQKPNSIPEPFKMEMTYYHMSHANGTRLLLTTNRSSTRNYRVACGACNGNPVQRHAELLGL
jgi:hypothetical protein